MVLLLVIATFSALYILLVSKQKEQVNKMRAMVAEQHKKNVELTIVLEKARNEWLATYAGMSLAKLLTFQHKFETTNAGGLFFQKSLDDISFALEQKQPFN